MAVAFSQSVANPSCHGTPERSRTFTMSLIQGWDEIPPEEEGRLPVAGDVVVLVVLSPETPVAGPSGWGAVNGRTFWKMLVPGEPDPVFSAEEPAEWMIRGQAFSGFAPADEEPSG